MSYMYRMYRKALDAAGYIDDPATEEAVRSCFADYVDARYWADLSSEDIEDIETSAMCTALTKGAVK